MVTDPDYTSVQINRLVSHSPLSPAGRHHDSRVEGASPRAGPSCGLRRQTQAMKLAVLVATGRQPATYTISCAPSHLAPFAMRRTACEFRTRSRSPARASPPRATVSRCHTVIFRDGNGRDFLRLHRVLHRSGLAHRARMPSGSRLAILARVLVSAMPMLTGSPVHCRTVCFSPWQNEIVSRRVV